MMLGMAGIGQDGRREGRGRKQNYIYLTMKDTSGDWMGVQWRRLIIVSYQGVMKTGREREGAFKSTLFLFFLKLYLLGRITSTLNHRTEQNSTE